VETSFELKETATVLPASSAAQAMNSKEMAEAAMSIRLAMEFRRNLNDVAAEIDQECSRYGLAEVAMYKFTKGGTVEGPSIRLAEVLARCFGNMDYGFKTLSRDENRTEVLVYAWDKQKNVRAMRSMIIDFKIKKKDGSIKVLTDPRDQNEHTASWAQRGVRAMILEIVPGDFVDQAVNKCKAALIAGPKNMTLAQRVQFMVISFQQYGITREMLEKKLGHPVDSCTPEELASLLQDRNAIKDKIMTPSEFMGEKTETKNKSGLNENFKKEKVEDGKAKAD
jgi:hypothetical protein